MVHLQPYENLPEEQLKQDRAEKRSMLDRVPGSTPEQLFMKEAAVAINEIQEQLEDEERSSPATAEGQEPAALKKIMARRKVARLATKWAQDYRWQPR
jgi:hypothetical protein